VLFIGDTFALDVVGAKSVGMDAALVRSSEDSPDLDQAQPDYTITPSSDLLEISRVHGGYSSSCRPSPTISLSRKSPGLGKNASRW